MKRLLTTLIAVLFLAGCQTAQLTPNSGCGGSGSGPWAKTNKPLDSTALRRLANEMPNFETRQPWSREAWFSGPGGVRMLCLSDDEKYGPFGGSCSGEWWIFREKDGAPFVESHDGFVCVT
jgi:hypothetical protein